MSKKEISDKSDREDQSAVDNERRLVKWEKMIDECTIALSNIGKSTKNQFYFELSKVLVLVAICLTLIFKG